MVQINIKGGLGNQMFQYAAAYALAVRNNTSLQLNVSLLKSNGTNTKRNYELDNFKLSPHEKIVRPTKSINRTLFLALRRFNKIFGVFPFKKKFGFYTDEAFKFDSEFNSLKDPIILEGFFQSPFYFSNVKKDIRKIFEPTQRIQGIVHSMLSQFPAQGTAISLHVRRGDYLRPEIQKIHGTCSPEYYKRAMARMKYLFPDAHFVFFSDDLEWTEKALGADCDYSMIRHEGPESGIVEMLLMSQCQHHIIANSSFSWWGAYLNTNNAKTVIAPNQWVTTEIGGSFDLIPREWIRL